AECVAVRGAPVDLGETHVGSYGARNLHVHLPLNEADGGGALGGGGGAVGGGDEVAGGVHESVVDDAIQTGKIALDELEVAEVEKLVLLEGATERTPGLVPPFREVKAVGVAVGGIQRAVAEEPVAGTVGVILTALGNGVNDTAQCAAELGREAMGKHLELLDGVLRNLGGDAGAAGILIVEAVGRVIAIGEEGVAARDSADASE